MLLGVTGDQVLPNDVYEKIKAGLHPTEFSEEYSRVRLDSVKNHVQFGLDIMNAFCSKSFEEVSQFSPISIRA